MIVILPSAPPLHVVGVETKLKLTGAGAEIVTGILIEQPVIKSVIVTT